MPAHFFLPPGAAAGDSFRLTGPEAAHLTRVLRFKTGDTVEFFDGKGGRFEGLITSVDEGVVAGSLKPLAPKTGAAAPLALYAGLLKGPKWDWLLEKATELGVSEIVPVLSARVVAAPDADKAASKRERWERVVVAAAKQCGRDTLPVVREAVSFEKALGSAGAGKSVVLFAFEALAGQSARAGLAGLAEAERVSLFIGPEGGFTEGEAEQAKLAGARLMGLGSLVLRAETAVLAALTLVQYERGRL